MGKTRELFKKIRDTKGTFHATMGSIKDRNGMDLTEAEDIKRGGKNTQKNCTKKISMTQRNQWCDHSPKDDILECEVKWALGRISMNKASGDDGIQLSYFKS